MAGRPIPGGYCNATSKTAITVQLVAEDPHQDPKASLKWLELIQPWWGREIQVGRPRRPRTPKRCNTSWVYDILGPPEFVEFLIKNNQKGAVICEHQIARVLGT